MFDIIKKTVRAFLSAAMSAAIILSTTPAQLFAFADKGNDSTVVTNLFSDDYTPVDVAILMDTSGSINWADPKQGNNTRTSRVAARRFITHLNSYDNRVAIYKYSGKDQIKRLMDLTKIDNPENIIKLYDTVTTKTEPDGDWTGILDAVKQSATYLQENSRENAKKIIVIFTDGAENVMIQEENYSSKDSMTKGINSALDDVLGGNRADNLIIYSVGYDCIDPDTGTHSIENNGFGAQILQGLADRTGGAFYPASEGLSSILKKFDEALGSVNFGKSKPVNEFAGDGKKHDTEFTIGPSVLNASITIDCDDVDALAKAKITLNYNDGTDDTYKNIKLEDKKKNSQGDIWRIDDTITMLQPKAGSWTLTIEDLNCDSDISIKLFNGYEVESRTSLSLLRNGAEAAIDDAQYGDTIKLNTKLFARDEEIADKELYTDPTLKARVYFTSEPPLEKNYVRNHTIDDTIDKLGSSFFQMNASQNGFELSEKGIDWYDTGYVSVFVYSTELDIRCFDCYAVTVKGAKSLKIIDQIAKQSFSTSSEPITIKELTSKCSPSNVDVSVDMAASCYNSQICDVSFDKAGDSVTITPLAIGSTQVRLVYTSQIDPSVTAEMLIDVEVNNSKPVFSLPDTEKHKDVAVNSDVVIENISKYVSDPDGDSIEISTKVSKDEAGFINAVYDAASDTVTVSGLAFSDKPLTVVINATDGTDTASESVTLTMIDDPDPFRIALRKGDITKEVYIGKTGKNDNIEKFAAECVKGNHDEPLQIIIDCSDPDAVDAEYDEKNDTIVIKGKKKTSKDVLITVKAFDGKRTTDDTIIKVKVKKPANIKLIVGGIVGGIAAVAAGIGAFIAIERSKWRVFLTIKKLRFTVNGKQFDMTPFNTPNIRDLFPSKRNVTVSEVIERMLDDTTWFTPDKKSAITAALNQCNGSAALSSAVFYGSKPVTGCRVNFQCSDANIDAGYGRGEAANFTITDGNGEKMELKLFDNEKQVMSILFNFE